MIYPVLRDDVLFYDAVFLGFYDLEVQLSTAQVQQRFLSTRTARTAIFVYFFSKLKIQRKYYAVANLILKRLIDLQF